MARRARKVETAQNWIEFGNEYLAKARQLEAEHGLPDVLWTVVDEQDPLPGHVGLQPRGSLRHAEAFDMGPSRP